MTIRARLCYYYVTMEQKAKKLTFKQFMRRYWYWFVVVPVLIAVSFVWMSFIGVFDNVKPVTIKTDTPRNINMRVNSSYHMVVTSDSDRKPVYSSSRPYVVEVKEDGFLIAHDEGIAVVTADFGVKRYQVSVNVYPFALNWYLTTGDKFTRQDVYNTFYPIASDLSSISVSGSEYLESTWNEEINDEEYVVLGDIPDNEPPAFISVGSPSKKNSLLFSDKGVLTVYLVPTPEIKAERTAAYEKELEKNIPKTPDIPDRVDEELTVDCGSPVELKPKIVSEGYLSYYLQGVDEDFPIVLDQRGTIFSEALSDEFYIVAAVSGGETWRWKCKAEPRSAPVYLSVGQKMLLEDYASTIPFDIVGISCTSAKLEALYSDEELIGYRALETTEQHVFIDCFSDKSKNYVTFRFIVTINDDPYEEPEENND